MAASGHIQVFSDPYFNMTNKTNILIFDPVVEDRIYRVSDQHHADLVNRFKLNSLAKTGLDLDAMRELLGEFDDEKPRIARGGSGLTIAFTMKRLCPAIDISFGGVCGGTDYSGTIREDFRKAGIALLPKQYPTNLPAQLAITCMLLPASGGRSICTYSGTLGRIINPAFLTEDLIERHEIVHLLGTNREPERLGPVFVDKIVELCLKHKKEFWLNLPTHKNFAEQEAGYFRNLVPHADIVLGNMDEARWVFGGLNPDVTLKRLQNRFQSVGTLTGKRPQIAFITDDKRPAYVVTQNKIIAIAAESISADRIVNNGGAGDTGMGGFLATYRFREQPGSVAASVAHALASQKLLQYDPCLEDPLATLRAAHPALATLAYGAYTHG